MKYLIATVLLLAACQPIADSPQLRATVEANAVDVLPVPPGPRDVGGYLRVWIVETPTVEPSLLPTTTPARSTP